MSDGPSAFDPPPPPPSPMTPPYPGTPNRSVDVKGFLDSLGPDGRERPDPRLSWALSGIGGALGTVGLVVLAAGGSGSSAPAYLISIALFASGWFGRPRASSGDVKAACVGMGIVSLLIVCGLLVSDLELAPGPGLLLTSALHVAVWVAPGYRGRSIFLALAALTLVFGMSSLVGGELVTNDYCEDLYYNGDSYDLPEECYGDSPVLDVPGAVGGFVSAQGVTYLILGSALMTAIGLLDRRGYRGVATSLVPSALVSIIFGIILMAVNMRDEGAAVLAAVAGVVLCLVGTRGERRATTWWGAFISTAGLIALMVLVVDPSDPSSIGMSIILAAGALVGIPRLLHLIAKSQANQQPT